MAERITLYDGMQWEDGEGHIGWFQDRMDTMKKLLTTYKPKNILEIGFNFGHSCKYMIDILGKENIDNLYLCDICSHHYVLKNLKILKENNEGLNIKFIEGDSTVTIPNLINDIKFDFINIDGEHSGNGPKVDMVNAMNRINIGGIIYLDDVRSGYPDIDNVLVNTNFNGFETHQEGNVFWIKKIN